MSAKCWRCAGVQPASGSHGRSRTDELVFSAFDLLFLNGESAAQLPLIQRGDRLQRRFKQQ
jgi:ATP-dependent DNA ligase